MKVIKLMVFFISLFLINYIGGIPTDLKNLFITHLIFLIPMMLELYSHLFVNINKVLHIVTICIFASTVIVCTALILGIFNIIVLNGESLELSKDFINLIPFQVEINPFVLFCTIVYVTTFMYTLLFSHLPTLVNQTETETEPAA